MLHKYLNREARKWVYGILLAAVPLLVMYGIVDQAAAPLWIALGGAVIAPALALNNLTPVDDGPVEELPPAEEA